MYYLHKDAVYGEIADGGAVRYVRLRVRGDGGSVTVEPAGESLPALPGSATPMTRAELIARAPREAKPAAKSKGR